jgi:Ca-activated chloride channel family protein
MYLILSNRDNLETILSPKVLKKLSIENSGFSKKSRNILLFASLFLMIIALSRPVIIHKPQNIKIEHIPLLLALDMSRSMNIKDIYPNRFEFAKKKSIQIINQSHNLVIGLIAFAKSSFVVSPLTYDFETLRYMIDNFTPDDNFKKGSDIMLMLRSSNELLKSNKTKNLIILTDGANKSDYAQEIKYAQSKHIKIYVISIGMEKKSPIPIDDESDEFITDNDGKIITLGKNSSIKELAIQSGGGYIDYTINSSDISSILDDIYSKSQKEYFDIQKDIVIYTELFYYPLALGLLVLFIALHSSSKNVILSILLLSSIFPNVSYAYLLDFIALKDAKNLYNQGKYNASIEMYNSIKVDSKNQNEIYYNMASNYYKIKDFEKSIFYLKKVSPLNKDLYFKAQHNLGNSYAFNHEYQEAIICYEKALKIKSDKETKHNLDELKREIQSQDIPNNHNQDKKKNNPKDLPKSNPSISNLEEGKWLEEIQKNNSANPVMMYELKKSKSKPNQKDDNNNSW